MWMWLMSRCIGTFLLPRSYSSACAWLDFSSNKQAKFKDLMASSLLAQKRAVSCAIDVVTLKSGCVKWHRLDSLVPCLLVRSELAHEEFSSTSLIYLVKYLRVLVLHSFCSAAFSVVSNVCSGLVMEGMEEWIGQFDLLNHVSYRLPSISFATDVASAVGSQALQLIDAPGPVTETWHHSTAVIGFAAGSVAGTAASYFGYHSVGGMEADKADDRMLAREVLKMAYHSASWRINAQAAYVPQPLNQTMTIRTFLEQAKALRPQQLAAELQSKGCHRVADLGPLLEREPELWNRMRFHSGHRKRLVQSIQFSMDGSWPESSLVPAPVACKFKLDFPHKQKSSCYLLPSSTIVLADRRSQNAWQLRAGARIQSFDVQRNHIANTKVERCSGESWVRLADRIAKSFCNSGEAVFEVILLDQTMKPYTLVVLEEQPLWGLTQEGYSWVCAGKGHYQEMSSLTIGDKLVHYSKKLCAVVEISPMQPSTFPDRLVHLSLQGVPTIFIDGFLASASVWAPVSMTVGKKKDMRFDWRWHERPCASIRPTLMTHARVSIDKCLGPFVSVCLLPL